MNQVNKQKNNNNNNNINNNNNTNKNSNFVKSIIKIENENEKTDESLLYDRYINDNYLENEIFKIDKEITMNNLQKNSRNYVLFERFLYKMLQKQKYEKKKYSKEKIIPIFDIRNNNAITHNIVKNKLLQDVILNNINPQTIKYIVTKMTIKPIFVPNSHLNNENNFNNNLQSSLNNINNINNKNHFVTFTDKRRLKKNFRKFLQSDKIYSQSYNKFPNNIVDFYNFDVNEYFDDNPKKKQMIIIK